MNETERKRKKVAFHFFFSFLFRFSYLILISDSLSTKVAPLLSFSMTTESSLIILSVATGLETCIQVALALAIILSRIIQVNIYI